MRCKYILDEVYMFESDPGIGPIYRASILDPNIVHAQVLEEKVQGLVWGHVQNGAYISTRHATGYIVVCEKRA